MRGSLSGSSHTTACTRSQFGQGRLRRGSDKGACGRAYHKAMQDGNEIRFATAGRDPGDRPPAPGSLRLVQALVNTVSVELGRDLLGTPQAAAAWLGSAGLIAAPAVLTEPERQALTELREAIRSVLAAHTSGLADQAAASGLTMALACCRLA